MTYVPNAVDYLNPRVWTGYVRDLPIPSVYIGYDYLPNRDVPSDHLMWDMLKAEVPLAPFVHPDAESPKLDDELLTEAWADVAYIRYKRVLKSSDVRIIRDFGMAPQVTLAASMATAARQKMGRQITRLNDSVDARIEWMQISSLLGAITVTPDSKSNVKFTVTYPVAQQTAQTLWSDTANSDPLSDIQTWYLNAYFEPATMIISRQGMYNLTRNQKLIRQIGFGEGMAGGTSPTAVAFGGVQRFFSDQMGLNIVVYNAQYTTRTDSGGNSVSVVRNNYFLSQNKAIFLPADPVGYTATAPAEQNNFATGKFSWMRDPNIDPSARDPWIYEVGVGFYGMPIIETPDRILVATIG